jgi:hypothetical protein
MMDFFPLRLPAQLEIEADARTVRRMNLVGRTASRALISVQWRSDIAHVSNLPYRAVSPISNRQSVSDSGALEAAKRLRVGNPRYSAARLAPQPNNGTGVSPVSFRFWRHGILLEHTGQTPVPLRLPQTLRDLQRFRQILIDWNLRYRAAPPAKQVPLNDSSVVDW